MRWADAIPADAPNGFKREAFRSALLAVTSQRPDLAVAWWESQAEHPYAQESLWVLALHWIPEDPDAAMEWLRSLPASSVRDEAIRQALRRWFDTEGETALRWMVQSDLPRQLQPQLPLRAQQVLRRAQRSDRGS
jgi:hypothetical protein